MRRRDRISQHAKPWICVGVYLTLGSCAQFQASPVAEPEPASVSSSPATAAQPPADATWRQRGRVSHYGNAFAGKPTASGETFDPERLTMAHRTLAFGTRVRVTNLENRQTVEVVVNDRGPFVAGRIGDLSAAAARQIGMITDGVVDALIEVLQPSKVR